MKFRKAYAVKNHKLNRWDLRVEQTHVNDLTGEKTVVVMWEGTCDVADPRKYLLHARDKFRARTHEIVE